MWSHLFFGRSSPRTVKYGTILLLLLFCCCCGKYYYFFVAAESGYCAVIEARSNSDTMPKKASPTSRARQLTDEINHLLETELEESTEEEEFSNNEDDDMESVQSRESKEAEEEGEDEDEDEVVEEICQ